MLSTAKGGKGGIATVMRQYEEAGLFDQGAVRWLETHHDRSASGRVLPFLRACLVLWWALAQDRVSLVHAHSAHGLSFWRKFLLLVPVMVRRIPILLHLHSGEFARFHDRGGPWRRYCLRLLLRRAFRVIALSAEWQRWALEVEPRARTVVVLNSLATPALPAGSEALGDTPTVLFLGRIWDRKGSFDLLRAFEAVHRRLPEARLVFGGDGEIDRLQAEIRSKGLDQAVRFAGWVDASQKEVLFREAWVYALPSYHEGLPMSILEAMARGRAVVSCPVGGIPEAVEEGRTGHLVAPGDISGLERALEGLLQDKTLAGQAGKAGREAFAAKFSNEAILPRLIDLYRVAGVDHLPVLRGHTAAHGAQPTTQEQEPLEGTGRP